MNMTSKNYTITLLVDQSPKQVFEAITNVRGWWSEEISGATEKPGDEFIYQFNDVHRSRIRIMEVIPDRKMVWLVLENFFSFTKDKTEWTGTKIIFDVRKQGQKTELQFMHEGLVPEFECYNACRNGWGQYINQSLYGLITEGIGAPNSSNNAHTVHEIAGRFNDLAQQEKWFQIQEELFADDVKSIEPSQSPYLPTVTGKTAVRRKAEEWVKKIKAVHRTLTTAPVVSGKYFAVGREMDITVDGWERLQFNELMVYEVHDGKIVTEQFFY